jgi:hypothetical protein
LRLIKRGIFMYMQVEIIYTARTNTRFTGALTANDSVTLPGKMTVLPIVYMAKPLKHGKKNRLPAVRSMYGVKAPINW